MCRNQKINCRFKSWDDLKFCLKTENNLRNLIFNIFSISVPRNYDPALHPFEAPREYVRALNAVKLERVFAKPFIGSLDGHREGVSCLCKHPHRLSLLASGDYDGEVCIYVVYMYLIELKVQQKPCVWLHVCMHMRGKIKYDEICE